MIKARFLQKLPLTLIRILLTLATLFILGILSEPVGMWEGSGNSGEPTQGQRAHWRSLEKIDHTTLQTQAVQRAGESRAMENQPHPESEDRRSPRQNAESNRGMVVGVLNAAANVITSIGVNSFPPHLHTFGSLALLNTWIVGGINLSLTGRAAMRNRLIASVNPRL